jgi:hypothetical protein
MNKFKFKLKNQTETKKNAFYLNNYLLEQKKEKRPKKPFNYHYFH